MITANELKIISSLKTKKYRKLYRKFLIEGPHIVEECLKSSYKPELIILREGFKFSSHPYLVKLINKRRVNVISISLNKFNKISDTENSQGIISVLPFFESSEEITGNVVLGLDAVSDPGNLGTILRTAYWFDVRDILIGKGSADIYNSKVIRASQGAVFHLNLIGDIDLIKVLPKLISRGYVIYLMDTNSENYINEIIKPEKSVLILGNEAHGINPELKKDNYKKVKIRGFSDCQSLNVAVSASIGLYEFLRG